jgi:uncharacterized cupin superfamily protein
VADAKPGVVLKAADIAAKAEEFSHPWNRNSLVRGTWLSQAAGMTEAGVALVTVPAGKESFEPHAHQCEDEWIYVLSGRGVAILGAREVEIGPGDFVAFPAPQEPHHTKNPFGEDLVYLMGGANKPHDVVDFPGKGRRLIKTSGRVEVVPLSAITPMDWTKRDDQRHPPVDD